MESLSAKGPHVSDAREVEILACRKAVLFTIEARFRDLTIEGILLMFWANSLY